MVYSTEIPNNTRMKISNSSAFRKGTAYILSGLKKSTEIHGTLFLSFFMKFSSLFFFFWPDFKQENSGTYFLLGIYMLKYKVSGL